MLMKVALESPFQCTGNFCPPTVALRAKTTASPSPRKASMVSNTILL